MMIKYRVREVAKDLDIPNKDVIDTLAKYFPEPKKYMTALNEEELEAFGEYLARILACFEERFMNKEAFAERRKAFEAFSHEQPHRRGRGGFPSDGRPLGYGINHEEEEGGED